MALELVIEVEGVTRFLEPAYAHVQVSEDEERRTSWQARRICLSRGERTESWSILMYCCVEVGGVGGVC